VGSGGVGMCRKEKRKRWQERSEKAISRRKLASKETKRLANLEAIADKL